MPTLAELITRVRVDESFNSTTTISDANLTTILQEGALDLAMRADALILTATWNAVANASTYILSGAAPVVSNFLSIYWSAGGLLYTQSSGNTKSSPNDFSFVSEDWLDKHIPGWPDTAASDTLQYVYLSHDSSGYLSLGVYPKSSTTTPSFKLYYTSRGTDMTGSNYPWTNTTTNLIHTEPYQKAIAYYALWVLHKTKTFKTASSDSYLQLYLATAAEFKESQRRIFSTELEGQTRVGMTQAMQQFGSS